MPSNHTAPGGVYAIRHVASGKMYIGSAFNIFRRWREHRSRLSRGKHENRYLQNAWDKHGPDAFVFEVLQVIEGQADTLRAEQESLDHFRPWRRIAGYNIGRVAGAAMVGRRHSAKSRARIAAALTGRPVSAETRAKLSASNTGYKHSPEALAKMSEHNRSRSPEFRANMSAARKGKRLSEEHRAKLSAAQKGRQVSPETRAKLSAAMKGRSPAPLSDDAKARISVAAMAYWSERRRRRTKGATQQLLAFPE